MTEEEQELRYTPSNDLDMQLMVTNSVWGSPEVSKELKDKLMRFYNEGELDEAGNVKLTKRSCWGILNYYTRDMRLANLSVWDGELNLCRYMIDLAGDFLDSDLIGSFIIALSRAACILETSQSKNGFLRKSMNTLTQRHIQETKEPPKKGFFGGGGNKQNGGF